MRAAHIWGALLNKVTVFDALEEALDCEKTNPRLGIRTPGFYPWLNE